MTTKLEVTRGRVASPLPVARPLRLSISSTKGGAPRAEFAAPSSRVARIGAQVRTLRMAAGTSAYRLAKLAGISPSLLSRVERGLVSPSVDTLDRIAESLHVPVSRLLGDGQGPSNFCHVQAGRGLIVDRGGAASDHRHELLGHLLYGNLFAEPYLVMLLPDAEPYATVQHAGLKFLYFLSGKVMYRYGDKTASVSAGDSLLFDATALHGIEAIDSGPVSYLSVALALRN